MCSMKEILKSLFLIWLKNSVTPGTDFLHCNWESDGENV